MNMHRFALRGLVKNTWTFLKAPVLPEASTTAILAGNPELSGNPDFTGTPKAGGVAVQLTRYIDATVTTGQLLALNATPKALVAAPGAGKFLVFRGVTIWLDYNSAAYAGIAAGEDLEVRYTDGSGQLVATIETDPFLTLTADALRHAYPVSTAAITPVENAALVLRLASGEITTGNSPLKVRTFYDVITTAGIAA